MKKSGTIPGIALLLLLYMTAGVAAAGAATRKDRNFQQDYVTIRGKVVDNQTGTPLVFATVALKESNVAIVTNIDGEFTLKVSPPLT
ncbi:MAG TPA: carboxypeptidase-like regulatory domain-containing protein, partial [Bacteroidales bacterium]|nr:carboxypeptidase-like regulatory domain-containing protein [Bacteroidales bacterium]